MVEYDINLLKMDNKEYICINGKMVPADEPSLYHYNRAFCYGDAIFETIHGKGSDIQFFDRHYSRMTNSMNLLGMEKTAEMEYHPLLCSITRLINKNHHHNGVRIRLSVFRNEGGYYSPENNSCSFIIASNPVENAEYKLNPKGYTIDIFPLLFKQRDVLAGMKSASSLLYVQAGLYKKGRGLDECVILNNAGRLAESVSSNIFLVHGDRISTPGLKEGCVNGIMRSEILRIASSMGMECSETILEEKDLLTADECFLTNAINGIRWVLAYRQKRFYRKTAKKLTEALNNDQFGN